MSKKILEKIKSLPQNKSKSEDYMEGVNDLCNYLDTALVDIFGQKLGIKISDYLLERGLNKHVTKKTNRSKKVKPLKK